MLDVYIYENAYSDNENVVFSTMSTGAHSLWEIQEEKTYKQLEICI